MRPSDVTALEALVPFAEAARDNAASQFEAIEIDRKIEAAREAISIAHDEWVPEEGDE